MGLWYHWRWDAPTGDWSSFAAAGSRWTQLVGSTRLSAELSIWATLAAWIPRSSSPGPFGLELTLQEFGAEQQTQSCFVAD